MYIYRKGTKVWTCRIWLSSAVALYQLGNTIFRVRLPAAESVTLFFHPVFALQKCFSVDFLFFFEFWKCSGISFCFVVPAVHKKAQQLNYYRFVSAADDNENWKLNVEKLLFFFHMQWICSFWTKETMLFSNGRIKLPHVQYKLKQYLLFRIQFTIIKTTNKFLMYNTN